MDAADIVELCLELGAEQGSVGGPIRQQVDPSPVPIAPDLNLQTGVPAIVLQVPRGVDNAAGVNEVVLFAPTNEPGRGGVHGHADPHQAKRSRCKTNVEA